MIKTYIELQKAIENVNHFTTPYPKGKNKGKTPLEISESGLTCYTNSLKVVKSYAANKFTVPTKAQQAQECLDKLNKK